MASRKPVLTYPWPLNEKVGVPVSVAVSLGGNLGSRGST